jgi:NADH-quinone oxidoreductase subunit F
VDLHPIAARPSDAERAAIDAVVGATGPETTVGLREAQGRRHLLLPALQAAQARVGWVSPGALGYVCERLHVPPAEGYGVASFYALLAVRERPPTVLHVCDDIACKVRGADTLVGELTTRLGPEGVAKDSAMWMRSPCLGLCEQAPAAMLLAAGEQPVELSWGAATADDAVRALRSAVACSRGPASVGHAESRPAAFEALARLPLPQAPAPERRLLRRVGTVDPTSLDAYRANGGYVGLRRALELGPLGVIREVTDAKLAGRGGAAFPTGRKWEAVARAAARPHYVVCNADESEPGTFKDRVLMEEDPFAVIEAMTVTGVATGSEKGYLYVRGEYPRATERLAGAIAAARARGLLGDDVMGRGVRFDVEIRRGGGAYICGEETALLNSIEGLRGEPRNKPPFPVDVGLFGKPTCVNNVETLVSALLIVAEGKAAWLAHGTPGSTGTKLFCLSGCVARPGVYEVPFGTRLDALIALAGGVPGGRALRTVLLGGAAGTFLRPDELALPLTFEDTRKVGASLGSGVVMLLDDRVDLGAILARIASFFRDESCGQCVPCRVGTVRQEELVTRLVRGAPLGSHGSLESERRLLDDLGQAMRDASICGLGQTASSAIASALEKLAPFGGSP